MGRAREHNVLLHPQKTPPLTHWFAAPAGVQPRVYFSYVILKHEAAVELLIDTGDKNENKRLFDALFEKKSQIERSFGGPFLWERLTEKQRSKVRLELKREGGLDDETKWPEIQEAMTTAMDKLTRAIKPHL